MSHTVTTITRIVPTTPKPSITFSFENTLPRVVGKKIRVAGTARVNSFETLSDGIY